MPIILFSCRLIAQRQALPDQASWHISEKLNIPENIRLIPQTSRSRQLNPVEHLWSAIRENYFYNEVFAAHAPTRRSQGQTYEMAEKLHLGERVFEAS